MLLLSPSFTSSFRTASLHNAQIRYTTQKSKGQRYVVPLDNLDPTHDSEEVFVSSNYKRGQAISFSVLRFGPMGASVSNNYLHSLPIAVQL